MPLPGLQGDRLGADAERDVRVRARLCGELAVELDGRRVEGMLPGRQGRTVFCYLAMRRTGATRHQLIDVLWPQRLPAAPDSALSTVIARLRRALGPGWIVGGPAVRLALPAGSWIDVEHCRRLLDEATAALDAGRQTAALDAAQEALDIAGAPLLPGLSGHWLDEARDEHEDRRREALRTVARAGLRLGGDRLRVAAGAARDLVRQEPPDDAGHVLLMEILAAQGNRGEALRTYDRLRVRHSELGAAPDKSARELHLRILQDDPAPVLAPDDARPRRAREETQPDRARALLVTDIEGSTRLWEEHPRAMSEALRVHDAEIRRAVEAHGGSVWKGTGDGFWAEFDAPAEAVAAAGAAQLTLADQHWPETGPLRVRMGVHTGRVVKRDDDYFGPSVNRCHRLMEAGHGGQILVSRAAAEAIGGAPAGDWTVVCRGEHRLSDLMAPEVVHELVHPTLRSEFPPLRTLDALHHNLPVQPTPLVGRERDLAAILARLGSTRLLTLMGVGGCGKTRLALQAAAEAAASYPDGVHLVELAPLADPSLVAAHVARAVGFSDAPEAGGKLEDRLVEALAGKAVLILLDNCEHVLDAVVPLVDRLLRSCPDVTVLATSQRLINVAGAQTWPVAPLGRDDAAALFIQRARAVLPSYDGDASEQTVGEICERLGGIPLAIELAAARVRHLSTADLAARLKHHFDLLRDGPPAADERQQTMRAALTWSHDLLDATERGLFRRLSVFAGGWTLTAAEAVCPGGSLARSDVLDVMSALVDKSLVVVDRSEGPSRYRLLEPVRMYAADRLGTDGGPEEESDLRRRHRDWFLEVARGNWPKLLALPRRQVERFVAPERDNFRAALDYSAAAGERDKLLELVATLFTFWVNGGHIGEGRRWAERALRGSEGANSWLRARVIDTAGELAQYQGEYDEAIRRHRAALEVWEERGHRGLGFAYSQLGLGRALTSRGDVAAIAYLEEALRVAEKREDVVLIAACRCYMATLDFHLGERARAGARFDEVRLLAESEGDPGLEGLSLAVLGALAGLDGERDKGRSLCDRAVAILEEDGDRWTQIWGFDWAAGVALLARDEARARELVARTLRLTLESGGYETLPRTLAFAASIVAADGKHAAAAELWGSAESINAKTGIAPTFRTAFAVVEDAPRAETERALDAATLRRATETGRQMATERAIVLALEQFD